MSEKKNVPGSAATLTGTKEKRQGVAAVPCAYSTTPQTQRQVVSEWLGVGEENGTTMKQLLQFLNGDSRTVRLEIERERKKGCPILSGQRGYWLCGSPEEANRFCSSMRSRARQIWATARAVETAVGLPQHEPQQMDGQTELWGGDTGG